MVNVLSEETVKEYSGLIEEMSTDFQVIVDSSEPAKQFFTALALAGVTQAELVKAQNNKIMTEASLYLKVRNEAELKGQKLTEAAVSSAVEVNPAMIEARKAVVKATAIDKIMESYRECLTAYFHTWLAGGDECDCEDCESCESGEPTNAH